MKCLINGTIVLKDRLMTESMIVFDDVIREIVPADATRTDLEYIDAKGRLIAPGLIDVHSHGCVGEDATTSDAEGIRKMCQSVATDGVTSWLPTLMTYPLESLGASFDMLRDLRTESQGDPAAWNGAEILGVNMEGPFISKAKKGAHLEEYIIPPDADFVLSYADLIRLITIAPELEGAMDLIKKLTATTETRVAVGHTAIGYEEALEAFDAGVTEVTHLFNAMNGIHHRNPGLVGAALTRKDVYCELIADTFHINKGLFQLVADCKKDRLVLITDSMRAAGLPDGDYDLGGQQVHKEGIHCLLADGTIAGSVLRLNQAVYNLYTYTDLTLPEAVACASLHPAQAIGVDARKGSIEVGKDADLILIDEDLHIYRTMMRGVTIYEQ